MALATDLCLVEVDPVALEALAEKLAQGTFVAPDWRMPVYPADDDESFVQFIGIQNSLNFCFADPVDGTKYGVVYQDIPWGGAMGLCAALLRAADEGCDLRNPEILMHLSLADVQEIFRSDDAALPLLAERTALLTSLPGSLAPYGGSFANLVEACGFDAGVLIDRLVAEFPAYAGDQWLHPVTKELYVFDKRARLFALIYEGRARASAGALPTLSNVDAIGPPVDYQLPRALRADGVLHYAAELAAAVDDGELLPAGSCEELEIRVVTEQVIWTLLELVNAKLDKPISMVELDYALWVAGRKAGGRHHLCLTTAY